MSSPLVPAPETVVVERAATPWSRMQRLLPLGVSLLITAAAAPLAIFITQQFDDPSQFGPFAYPLLFLTQMLVSATIFLPAPGVAVAAAAGTFLHPFWVGVVAGLGSATGELSGYFLGYYGRSAVPTDTSRLWRLAERGFTRWGFLAIIVLAFIPNPAFDALGILAGGLRYPLARFWLSTAAGKILKFCCFSFFGALVGAWLRVG
jgi:membrane protein YqaA with SNARE-associated domain